MHVHGVLSRKHRLHTHLPTAIVFLQKPRRLFLLPYKNEDFPATVLHPAASCLRLKKPAHRYNHWQIELCWPADWFLENRLKDHEDALSNVLKKTFHPDLAWVCPNGSSVWPCPHH